jgi:hypothetical protein
MSARPLVRGLAAALGALSLAAVGVAQGDLGRGKDRAADPSCEHCLEDPALMAAAGVLSHGGFEFGRGTTADVEELLPMVDLVWVETPHFELGFGLGPHKVRSEERDKLREELTRLAMALPEVDPRAKTIDQWLRAHLYAQRLEEVYALFQKLMQVEDADFPKRFQPWNGVGTYMGMGPFLGQGGKFEVLMLPSQATSEIYLENQFGLLISHTQRWNLIDRETLSVTMHLDQGSLRRDGACHGHLAFNVTINLLDAYKHYSYDLPVWIKEGLGHYVERSIDPDFNTFDSSEGAVADTSSTSDWGKEVLELVRADKAPRMAELVALRTYAELEKRHHYASWSLFDWLVRTDPDGLACFADRMKGQLTPDGYPDGSNLPDAHRETVSECLKMTYAELDQAWRAWAEATY